MLDEILPQSMFFNGRDVIRALFAQLTETLPDVRQLRQLGCKAKLATFAKRVFVRCLGHREPLLEQTANLFGDQLLERNLQKEQAARFRLLRVNIVKHDTDGVLVELDRPGTCAAADRSAGIVVLVVLTPGEAVVRRNDVANSLAA